MSGSGVAACLEAQQVICSRQSSWMSEEAGPIGARHFSLFSSLSGSIIAPSFSVFKGSLRCDAIAGVRVIGLLLTNLAVVPHLSDLPV
jgi:hypothetical protein